MREVQGLDVEINIYHHNELRVEKVLTATASNNKLDFQKTVAIDSTRVETNLWKENFEGAEIYKILTNCFSKQDNQENQVFEPKDKDLKELVNVFKISQEDAVTALEQCDNVEDALAWLADPAHKVIRKRKTHSEYHSQ